MSDKNKTYCLINYGCQMNESDTEHYAGQLQELGYAPNPDFTLQISLLSTPAACARAQKRKLPARLAN